jgi:hypothetical protein
MRADVLHPQQAAQKDLMGAARPLNFLNGLNRLNYFCVARRLEGSMLICRLTTAGQTSTGPPLLQSY